MERISSRQNPLVRRFRGLARAGRGEWMLVDGDHLVGEALDSGVGLDVVAFAERLVRGRLTTLAARVQGAGARAVVVPDVVLAAMSPVQQPTGVVAIARRQTAAIAEVLARAPQLVLFLSEVQDPGNVGAIVRTAEACGATGIVAGEACADPFGWKALRGAMGSTFRLPVAARQDLAAAMDQARGAGLRLYATVPRGGTPLPLCDLQGPCGIVLGGEGPGLPASLMHAHDSRLTIPMRSPVESLNVAIAAALILYEASTQRATRAVVTR